MCDFPGCYNRGGGREKERKKGREKEWVRWERRREKKG